MRSVTLKLPKHLDDLLQRLARQRGISQSAVIREALEAYGVEPKESVLSRAGDLIGSLKGLPRDLSTNPKHMKDFGK